MLSLSGPVSTPANATVALVCLHGFGADGHDLASLIPPLRKALESMDFPAEKLAVFCPTAPHPTPFGQGHQWFSDNNWTFRDRPGIQKAASVLWDYLTGIKQEFNIPYSRMVILGFSQGAMTTLFAAPRFPEAVAGIIAHSGCAMYQEELNAETCQKPPVLFLHGIEDDVVPADQSLNAAKGLDALGFTTATHLIPHLAHGFNATSLAHISFFIKENLVTS